MYNINIIHVRPWKGRSTQTGESPRLKIRPEKISRKLAINFPEPGRGMPHEFLNKPSHRRWSDYQNNHRKPSRIFLQIWADGFNNKITARPIFFW